MKPFKIITIALFLIALIVALRSARERPPQPLSVTTPTVAEPVAEAPVPPAPPRRSPTLAKIIGITNFADLTPEKLRHYEQVVAPGVSNFVALLHQVRASRFDSVTLSGSNFLSLHDPKPGNIWDLKIRGNNGRDYFMRFNETQEMGIIAALTNVVSFWPMRGPSIQGAMDAVG